MGDFTEGSSDYDVLVVVSGELSSAAANRLRRRGRRHRAAPLTSGRLRPPDGRFLRMGSGQSWTARRSALVLWVVLVSPRSPLTFLGRLITLTLQRQNARDCSDFRKAMPLHGHLSVDQPPFDSIALGRTRER